jgi:hypothetical protein
MSDELRKQEIRAVIGTRDYWRSEDLQHEYRGMLEREAGEQSAPVELTPEMVARKGDLEKLMAKPSSEYWKGVRAEAHQSEYRQLLTAQQAERE